MTTRRDQGHEQPGRRHDLRKHKPHPSSRHFSHGQIGVVRSKQNNTVTVYRAIGYDAGQLAVREIAAGFRNADKPELVFISVNGCIKGYHEIIPLELPTAAELAALRVVRNDVQEDTPTVENA